MLLCRVVKNYLASLKIIRLSLLFLVILTILIWLALVFGFSAENTLFQSNCFGGNMSRQCGNKCFEASHI
jgi:hypothetical protein